jgi:hypothetical protein
MDISTRRVVHQIIKSKILRKIESYDPESKSKPFFEAIFNQKTIRQASLMQSLYTSFGMSFYEQIAILLAKDAGFHAERQFQLLGTINNETRLLIDGLCEKPFSENISKKDELEMIRNTSTLGEAKKTSYSTVDVFIEDNFGNEYYIDITSVKPNKKEARVLRKKMLDWAALRFSQNPNVKVRTYIGLPYNPYHPSTYNRSFVRDNCHKREVLVQEDFWHLCAGYDVFDELINIFKDVGNEIKEEIDDFIDGV